MAQPKKKAPAKKRASKPAGAAQTSTREALVELRTTLTRGVVLTRERINETLEDAVRRGRMTRDDAEELAASLVGLGRRQAQDLLGDVETLIGSGKRRTAQRTDKLVQQVDRARRAVNLPPTFPILGYDDLTAAQVTDRLDTLSAPELRKVRDHERRNANRKSVLAAIDKKLD